MHIVHPKQLAAIIDGKEYTITELVTVSGEPPAEQPRFIVGVITEVQTPKGPMRSQRQVALPFATVEEAFANIVDIVNKTQVEMIAELKRALNPIVLATPIPHHNGANLRLRN